MTKLIEKPKTPWEEASRYWREIAENLFQFDIRQKTADFISTFTKQTVIDFFRAHVARAGPQRAKLCTQVFGNMHSIPSRYPQEHKTVDEQDQSMILAALHLENKTNTTVRIDEMDDFKRQMPLYPVQGKPRAGLTSRL